jgi:hypothetical protein
MMSIRPLKISRFDILGRIADNLLIPLIDPGDRIVIDSEP